MSLKRVNINNKRINFRGRGDTGANLTPLFFAAVEEAAATGRYIEIGYGVHDIDGFDIPNAENKGIGIYGQGEYNTTLKARNSARPAFISTDTGRVVDFHLGALCVEGNVSANNGQYPVNLVSDRDNDVDAGLWLSEFKNLRFINWNAPLWLAGGTDTILEPHQFNTWREVWFDYSDHGGMQFVCTGQHGQSRYENCKWTGDLSSSGWSLFWGTESKYNNGNIDAGSTSGQRPDSTALYGCTIQDMIRGVYLDNVTGWQTDGQTLFENVQQCINITAASTGVMLNGLRFAECGQGDESGNGVGAGSGYLAQNSVSHVVYGDWEVINSFGGPDEIVLPNEPLSSVFGGYIYTGAPSEGKYGTHTKQIAAAASIDLSYHSSYLIDGSGSPSVTITNIVSKLAPGQIAYCKAFAGDIVFSNSGNIEIGAASSPLTITQNQYFGVLRRPHDFLQEYVILRFNS